MPARIGRTRKEIVAEARSWIGTPFKHQGRRKGHDVDCGGLVLSVGWAMGEVLPGEIKQYVRSYVRNPHDGIFELVMDSVLEHIEFEDARPGDVALIKFDRENQHAAIFGDYAHGGLSLIHALSGVGKVVEHRLDKEWRRRITAVYRFPGIED